MKLLIAWIKKGKTKSWTNSNSHEHAAMALRIYSDAMKRLSKDWNCSVDEVIEAINNTIETVRNEKGCVE